MLQVTQPCESWGGEGGGHHQSDQWEPVGRRQNASAADELEDRSFTSRSGRQGALDGRKSLLKRSSVAQVFFSQLLTLKVN